MATNRKRAATTKGPNAPKRKKRATGGHHRVSAKHDSPSRKKSNGRRTVAKSRKRT